MSNKIIDNSLGNFFGPPQIGSGFLLIAIGCIITFSGGFAGIGSGILILLFGGIICFSKSGIQVNLQKKEYKKYLKLFFIIKIGSWKDMSDYDYVTILKSNKGYTATDLTAKRMKVNITKYDVLLINSNNSKRILIKSMDNKYIAMSYAKDISDTTSFKFLNSC
jgi:hypothetical protein